MEERLLALIRLLLTHKGKTINFNVFNQETQIEIRFSDNNLHKVKTKHDDYKLVRYLQYLSNIDVSNNSSPQTGSFELQVDGKNLMFRFAIISDGNRANCVLKLMNNVCIQNVPTQLADLVKHQKGLIIIYGPVDSGKSTLAYEMLKTQSNRKIYSIQDSITSYSDSFVQLVVNEETGFNMSNAIKQVLRHDPDILLVDSIKSNDTEAAKMALNAAITGHLVVAVVHSLSDFNIDNKQALYDVLLAEVKCDRDGSTYNIDVNTDFSDDDEDLETLWTDPNSNDGLLYELEDEFRSKLNQSLAIVEDDTERTLKDFIDIGFNNVKVYKMVNNQRKVVGNFYLDTEGYYQSFNMDDNWCKELKVPNDGTVYKKTLMQKAKYCENYTDADSYTCISVELI